MARLRLAVSSVLGSLLPIALVSACSDDPATSELDAATSDAAGSVQDTPEASTPDAPPDAADSGQPRVSFEACPGAFSGACATLEMPLDWSQPDGKKIGVLVDKIVSVAHPKRQVWLLQGGPGATAASLVAFGPAIADRLEDVEVLTIEHRGVGASGKLSCPVFEASLAASPDAGAVDTKPCYEEMVATYGADLQHYTTTAAARDLASAIERLRRPDVPVLVWGGSYGTAWAQRFMQVAPSAAAGVVLDSIVAPGTQFLSNFDTQQDPVGQQLGELCKADAACSAALGADPWAKVRAAKAKLEAGHCPEAGLTLQNRTRLTQLLQNRIVMGYALAVWHRFDRCAPEDVAAIRRYFSVDPFADTYASLFSPGLYANVAFSELWESPAPTEAVLQARFDAAVFAAGTNDLGPIYPIWPKYPQDEFVGKYPSVTIPLLMLAGGLDSQTPLALQETVKTHYDAPHQTFVTMPLANHGVISQSPVTDGATASNCGFEVMLQFLANPEAELDVSCATQVDPIQFTRPVEEVQYLFGTDDLWQGGPQPTPAPLPPAAASPNLPRL